MSQHRSVWLATGERLDLTQQTGDVTADVAVVGAGITGLTVALLLQRSGADVVVIEAGEVGEGTTGHTTGKVTSQHGLTYHRLIQHHGDHKAFLYADANHHAISTIETLAAEISADCQLERAPAFVYTREASGRRDLEDEHAAAVRLGLPATLTTEVDLPFPVELALRFDDQAHLHPTRYTTALARAIIERGGRIFTGTRALAVDEEPSSAVVQTTGGEVTAANVVVATLVPFVDRGGFFAKMRPTRAYGVSAHLRSGGVSGMHISSDSPTRSTRPWVDGDRRGLVVVGETHPTGGEGEATPARWGELERWARESFDIESFEHRWSSQDFTSADDVPYVGRSPRCDRTFVATGFRKWGLTNGTAAATVLSELLQGRDHPWLELFDATRIGDAQTVKKLVEDNAGVAVRFVTDRIRRLNAGSLTHLAPGDGDLVKVDGSTVGAYRDPAGDVHAVSATCTHMGCTLRWNRAETSWDCPCHGSRFSHDGAVLDGPAVRPLERVEVEPDR